MSDTQKPDPELEKILAQWRRDRAQEAGGDTLPGETMGTVVQPSAPKTSAHTTIALGLATSGDSAALHRALETARRLRDNYPEAQDAWQVLLRCPVAVGESAEAALEGARLLRADHHLGEA